MSDHRIVMMHPIESTSAAGYALAGVLALSLISDVHSCEQDPSVTPTTGPQVEVVGFDLSVSNGTLAYLDHERLVLIEGDSVPRTVNPDEIAYLTVDGPDDSITRTPPPSYSGRIWLTDGSYYSTEPVVRRDSLIWKNDLVGRISASIDEMVAFNASSIDFPASSPDDDLVVLENGDRIEGLIGGVDRTIRVEQVDETEIDIPLERVSSFSLINEESPGSGARLWSIDGDRIALESYRYEEGLGLIFGDQRIHVPALPGRVTAITHDVDRLIPLADQPVRTLGIEGKLRYHNPPPTSEVGIWPLDAAPMLISGPIRLEWNLPKNDLGLIASAVLPSAFRRHGSVELIISDETGELLRRVLTRDQPTCDIRLRIRGRRLVMELHENGDGPLQDSIRLQQALLVDAPITD